MNHIIKIKLLRKNAKVPSQATKGSAGFDLISCAHTFIPPGGIALIPIGIATELPDNLEAQVRPRSGLAFKHGITVLNTPGTIDSDFRGELCVIIINHGHECFVVEEGMKIAQLVIKKVEKVVFMETESLTLTERGEKGCGSTGNFEGGSK